MGANMADWRRKEREAGDKNPMERLLIGEASVSNSTLQWLSAPQTSGWNDWSHCYDHTNLSQSKLIKSAQIKDFFFAHYDWNENRKLQGTLQQPSSGQRETTRRPEEFFTKACSDNRRGDGFKLKKGRFSLDIRKKFFSLRCCGYLKSLNLFVKW